MNLVTKFLVIKVSVGIVLIEGIVIQFLSDSNKVNIKDNDGMDKYSEDEKFVRLYCFIALTQIALLSYFLYTGFSSPMTPHGNVMIEDDVVNRLELKDGVVGLKSNDKFFHEVISVRTINCGHVVNLSKDNSASANTSNPLQKESTIGNDPLLSKFDATF